MGSSGKAHGEEESQTVSTTDSLPEPPPGKAACPGKIKSDTFAGSTLSPTISDKNLCRPSGTPSGTPRSSGLPATIKPQNLARGRLRACLASVIAHRYFDIVMCTVIVVNAALIGLQADFEMQSPGKQSPLIYRVSDMCFLGAFTIELVIRFFAAG